MIKSLLNSDDEPSPEIKSSDAPKIFDAPSKSETSSTEKTEPITETPPTPPETAPQAKIEEPRNVFEIPETAKFFAKPEVNAPPPEEFKTIPAADFDNLLQIEEEKYKTQNAENPASENFMEAAPVNIVKESFEKPAENGVAENNQSFSTGKGEPKIESQSNYEPETPADTIRKSGMAYSAAIVLVGAVVFMMLLGWFADLLLGTSPIGIVGGIILGAIIGFIQFFRITSSIFNK